MAEQQLTVDQAAALATQHYLQGDLAQAESICRQVLAVAADHFQATHVLGLIAHRVGRNDVAADLLRRAVELNPAASDAHNNLGEVYRAMNRLDDAAVAYRLAFARDPNHPEAYNNLGIVLALGGRHAEAIEAWKRAIEINPAHADVHNNLGNLFQVQGRIAEAIEAHRRAAALDPRRASHHSNLLRDLTYSDAHTPQQILAEHAAWWQRHGEPHAREISPHKNDRDPDRRLRVGFLSPDFREHAVAQFIEPLFASRDRERLEFTCYAEVPNPDETTRRLHALSDRWQNTIGATDAMIAGQVRQDGIDVLIDLAGHTGRSRIVACAYKPAPVQMTYLGYPFSSGLKTIDYRITDAHADPPGASEAHYVERLLRLPDTAWCYKPHPDAPPVGEPPFAKNGFVTFGSFNNFAKVSAGVVETWSRLLLAVPASKLMLKYAGLGDPSFVPQLLERFAGHGIGPQRLILADYERTTASHLAHYGEVDVALDTFPYAGTTTTCEAMWMGVPVVTLAGQIHLSRVGVSLLSNVGHDELIARDRDDYVARAKSLADDPQRMREIRATLRGAMEISVLCDGHRFARAFEAMLRSAWRAWCESGS